MPKGITFHHVTVYLALAKKDSEDGQLNVAMAFDKNGSIMGYAIDDHRGIPQHFDSRSAIVNLLQHLSQENPISIIATTSPPNERDLGIARMAKVTRINYFDPHENALRMRSRKQHVINDWNPPNEIPLGRNIRNPGIPILNNLTPKTARDWYKTHISIRNTPFNSGYADLNPKLNKVKETFVGVVPRYTHFVREKTKLTLPNLLIAQTQGGTYQHPATLVRDDNDRRHQIFMLLAWAIVGESISVRNDGQGPYPGGHAIGSVLRGPRDEILAWGLNTKNEQWSLHGEVNLIQTYQDRIGGGEITGADNINSRPILYTTLEPCYMCAGMYRQSGTHVYCYYGQDDPGIQDNALASNNLQAEIGTRFGQMVGSTAELLRTGKFGQAGSYSLVDAMNGDDVKKILSRAIHKYIDLVPDSAAERGNWINHQTPESYIWENGLKLLHHINPGVLAKWQARNDRYYQGVI